MAWRFEAQKFNAKKESREAARPILDPSEECCAYIYCRGHGTPEIGWNLCLLGEADGEAEGNGYTSRTDLVVHDVEEEQRETTLKFHSERLAIAFGIISTPIGMPLRIFKNLRVCEDCPEAIKYISRAVDREIVVRDLYRFHHFKSGSCSCEDFWWRFCSNYLWWQILGCTLSTLVQLVEIAIDKKSKVWLIVHAFKTSLESWYRHLQLAWCKILLRALVHHHSPKGQLCPLYMLSFPCTKLFAMDPDDSVASYSYRACLAVFSSHYYTVSMPLVTFCGAIEYVLLPLI